MKMTLTSFVLSVIETVSKDLKMRLKELGINERIEIIQTATLLRLARIPKKKFFFVEG